MAEIIDEHNQKAIEIFLLAADPTGKHFFWIGLTDLFHEGTFIWSSTGEKATYFNWNKGEPNNRDGIEHFVHAYFTSFGRKWNDVKNDTEGVYALCQFSV